MHVDSVFINDVTRKREPLFNSDSYIIYVLPKVYAELGRCTSLNQTKKAIYRNYSENNIQSLKTMFCPTKFDFHTNAPLGVIVDVVVILNSAFMFIDH